MLKGIYIFGKGQIKINWKTKHQKWVRSSKINLVWIGLSMKCGTFSNILRILQESVPSKMSSSRFSLHWINRTIKQISRQKNRNFDKARRTKKKSDIARYRKLKSATQKECRKAYKDYVESIFDPDLSSNPKDSGASLKVNVVNQQVYHP